ncbi:MAG TPA: AsmA-like C-terminal region-containing protein, partial [Phycisphaerae bacterium]|nr:AsmA-like C-terminal region-containing protein [Phycisphaerae bacterium]
IQQYDPQGDFSVVEGEGTDPQDGRFEIRLDDFSFNMPDGDKVFAVKNVTGKLLFRRDGIEFKSVTGRPVLLGPDARIRIDGHCDGYSSDSSFDLTVYVKKILLPQTSLPGRLAVICRVVNRDYQPRGLANMGLRIVRDKNGDLQVAGIIKPEKLRTCCRFFPIEAQAAGGSITFTQKSIEDINLDLYRGQSRFTVRGSARHIEGMNWDYDVSIDGSDVKLDDSLRDALPNQARKIYDSLSPAGKCNGKVIAWKKGEDRGIKVDLRMNGFASVCYDGFPYRLENLSGEVHVENGNISVPWAQSEKGDMVVRMNGRFSDGCADMDIAAKNLPLDKKLFDALPVSARDTVNKLSLSGMADQVSCHASRQNGRLDFNVDMKLQDVSWKYAEWPYAVEGASGDITITPDAVTLRNLQGHHGMGRITLDGDIKYAASRKLACELLVQGASVMFDGDFFAALPPAMRSRLEEFSLGGLADFRVKIKSDGTDAPVDFNVAIDASSMDVCYKKIPIPLTQVSGRILIKPGRLELNNVQGVAGQDGDVMSVAASGYIENTPSSRQANLALNIVNVELDKTLMDSFSSETGNFLKRFRPGGRFSGKIRQFFYNKPKDKPAEWKITGGFAFKDIEMDFGFGWRKLTGTWAGWLWREEKGMGMKAQCKVDRLKWDKYVASKLSGDLTMQPGSDLIFINKLVGRSMGGRIAGKASLDIGTPLKYNMNLAMEDVDLAELFRSADGNSPKDVSGKLRGEVEFSMIGGDKPMKQAAGEIEIYKASMYKMPVILGMLNVIYLTVPGDGTFNSGFLRYHMKNEKLRLEEIFLTGSTLSVIGSGDLNLSDDTLNLTFLTGPPGKMPRLNELATDLLSAISQELVEIRVSGTLKKPKMETVSFRSLETIIKRLVGTAAEQN